MVELILKAIDRLIDLLERRKKSDRSIFTDHIEPLFSDLTQIHADYMASLDDIDKLAKRLSLDELKLETQKRRQALAPLRTKVAALSDALYASDFGDPVVYFALAAKSYFDLTISTNPEPDTPFSRQHATGMSVLSRIGFIYFGSAFTTLIEMLGNWEDWSSLLAGIEEVRHLLALRWSALTVAYAKVRLHLLRP